MPEIKFKTKWKIGTFLYIKTDPDQFVRQLTNIDIGPGLYVRYGVAMCDNEPSYHHELELAEEPDVAIRQQNENRDDDDEDK